MNNIFVIAAIISILFLLAKFIEMRFIEKENKPLKFLIRDSLIVYIATVLGILLQQQLEPVMEGSIVSSPAAFTDNPSF